MRDEPVVILAGGRGARFDHESMVIPKPMIKVAGKPILQHIIDSFAGQGFRQFIVPTGYLHHHVDSYLDSVGRMVGPWSWACKSPLVSGVEYLVTARDTGERSHTGLRLWQVRDLIADRRFVLTYGDGLSDVDMGRVLEQHRRTDAMVTVTAVRPPSRFGAIEFEGPGDSAVHSFSEKPETSVGWINGGFMAVEPEFIDRYIEGEFELESTALRELAACGGLHAYRHEGFWMCMDTRRDRESIEEHVRSLGRLPWIGG